MDDNKRIIGIVLAAGKGTRMYPFSDTLPKVMLRFWGKPLLAYHIDEFIDAGINEIVIVCSDENIDIISDYFSELYPDTKISYAIQKKPLGTANAIDSARDIIRGSMAIIKFGDNISKSPISRVLLDNYNGFSNGIITLRRVENPSEYGIAVIEDEAVVEIIEKPENPPSDMASMGGFMLDSDILLDGIDKFGYYSKRNGQDVEMPLPQYFLMQNLKLGYAILNEPVLDVGRPFDIISATDLFSAINHSSRTYVGDDARIGKNCIIKGACSIEGILEDNVTLINSYVMKGSRIGRGSIISHSVIGENVSIGSNVTIVSERTSVLIKGKLMDPKRIVGSFIGSDTVISDNSSIPAGIIISPNSRV
jgi:UDP-N-acetylglucosamine diphosphorylase / glucose-1-phosphate thymidylyltransferase / UDP-N-acetylgalactosamine diphosphorylase / glucosamine-1-phosphate N-acetyltransferase / galactosamine-1-phosphate N-acetyltransferase